jgi:hypothetical protein
MTSLRYVLLLAALLLGACGIARFPLGYDIAEQYVSGNPLGGLLGPISVPIPLDIDLASETAARDTGPAQHVYLVGLTLSVTTTDEPAGDTDDLSFVDSIEIFIEPTSSGSTLTRQRVAHLNPAPDGTRSLSLETDGVDLIQYLREGARLTSSASGTVPPDDVSYTGHLELAIEVL